MWVVVLHGDVQNTIINIIGGFKTNEEAGRYAHQQERDGYKISVCFTTDKYNPSVRYQLEH